jgi:4-cresol dehydrogenase (hydroxylating) flavoprotein subunit
MQRVGSNVRGGAGSKRALLNSLAAWRAELGVENVISEPGELEAAETATFATTERIVAILRPANVAEVEASVQIANRYATPIYAVSRGRNWGLGSRVPTETGCALLDLGRLDRIVDYNEQLGYITVQPGVTFRQVHDFLRAQKSRFFAAVTGGPPDGSLLGNALERGEGAGPYGDRAAHICGMEVVLPSGETMRTGFCRFENATTARLSQWGVGPYLDGLFVQSSFGIVTELTVWLYPRPKRLVVFSLSIDDTGELAQVIDVIQPLVLEGTIASHSFGLWNAYKLMAIRGRYPWQAMKNQTPLCLRALGGREPWVGSGALYAASEEQAAAGRKRIEAAFARLPRALLFQLVDDRAIEYGSWVGEPKVRNLRSTYWRKKTDPTGFGSPYDPHRHHCGVMWLHPALPFVGEHVVKAVRLMESTTAAHGFEPLIGMSCATGRIINVYLALMYDREVACEDARAMACHDELLARLTEEGYPPYRLGVQSMSANSSSVGCYGALIDRLKSAIDPNGILAPGRYDFKQRTETVGSQSIKRPYKRPYLDPKACLAHLAAHQRAFRIGFSSPLRHLSELISNAKSATLECSLKVERGRTHPARFNVWFPERASEQLLAAALGFLAKVEKSEKVRFNDSAFRRFCKNMNFARIEAVVTGVDLRKPATGSRLKIWFKLRDYPQKVEQAFKLGSSSASLRQLQIRTGLLVGFDFYFDGRTAIKIYTRIERADLYDRAARIRLASVLPEPVLVHLESCDWAYVSLTSDFSDRVLHFRPSDPKTFIARIMDKNRAARILNHPCNQDALDTVLSVREKELLAARVRNYNLYFMHGAASS